MYQIQYFYIMKVRYSEKMYDVAGSRFVVRMESADAIWNEMTDYMPFLSDVEHNMADADFSVDVSGLIRIPEQAPFFMDAPEGSSGPCFSVYKESAGWCFTFSESETSRPVFSLHTDMAFSAARLRMAGVRTDRKRVFDTAMMLMFALNTGGKGLLLIKSAVLEECGRGIVMFGHDSAAVLGRTDAVMCGFVAIRKFPDEVCVSATPWSAPADRDRRILQLPVKQLVWLCSCKADSVQHTDVSAAYASLLESALRFRLGALMTDSLLKNAGPIAESVPFNIQECQAAIPSL